MTIRTPDALGECCPHGTPFDLGGTAVEACADCAAEAHAEDLAEVFAHPDR